MKSRYYYLVIVCLLVTIGWRLSTSFKKEYKHSFAVCAMFKNEAPWLKEWIDYHHNVLGASHFYLYNNESTDDYEKVLQPYIEQGLVELISWENTEEHAIRGIEDYLWVPYQFGAYNDCLKNRALGVAKWVAILDIDEFIVPTNGAAAFADLLEKEAATKTGSLQMYWKVFGTSHIASLNPGDLLTEKLNLRAVDSHPWNQNMKSIHRPEAIQIVLVHEAKKLNHGYRRKKLEPDLWRIHHYWTRTEKELMQKRKSSPESMPFYEEFNTVEDTTFYQYLPKLKNV